MTLTHCIFLATTILLQLVNGDVTLTSPPTCYKNCLSSILADVGCSFSDLNCYCGTGNTNFTGQLVGCVSVNCNTDEQNQGASFLAGACAVLTSGQTTLPASLATLIPSATATSDSISTTSAVSQTLSSPSPTSFKTITTTNSAGQVESTTINMDAQVTTIASNSGSPSTGALIGGIVGGIVGFVIIALLLMSVVLYILVRRSLERRQSDADAGYSRERKHSPNLSRSSVAASDTPEEELNEMEPSFWGVVTRPKQALRVVNG